MFVIFFEIVFRCLIYHLPRIPQKRRRFCRKILLRKYGKRWGGRFPIRKKWSRGEDSMLA